jgi:hypothetical protein
MMVVSYLNRFEGEQDFCRLYARLFQRADIERQSRRSQWAMPYSLPATPIGKLA